MSRRCGLPAVVAGLLLLTGHASLAQNRPQDQPSRPTSTFGAELERFFYDEAEATLHVRSYYFEQAQLPPPNTTAFAGGGWITLKSGWLYDTVQVGATGYASLPLWAPNDPLNTVNGSALLLTDGYALAVLGEAWASARWKGQTFTGFRQTIDELEVNPQDNRMIPQTFEAYALRGRLASVNYFAGYIAAMKPRDANRFVNMAEIAGVPNDNAGMGLVSLKYGTPDRIALRTSFYYVPDILWSNYNDVSGTIRVDDNLRLRLSGQFMEQGSNGQDLLIGHPFGTFVGGVKADAMWGPLTMTLAYMQTGSAFGYQTPYGIFIGYDKQQQLDFNRAGERSFQVGALYDFASIGLRGVTFAANAVQGSDAIDPTTGAPESINQEYDLDLRIRASELPVPDFLKPLRLRGQIAFLDEYGPEPQTLSSQTQYRVILNYELTWQGPRRRAETARAE